MSAPPTVAISNRIDDGDSHRVQLWKALDRWQVKVRPGVISPGTFMEDATLKKKFKSEKEGKVTL